MKSKLFTIIAVFIILFAGACQIGTPIQDEKPSAAPAEADDTVWSLLAQNKVSEAKDMYLGKTNVRERDDQGRTTLHIAAEMKNPDLAAYLLALGAEVDAEDNRGRTPLSISTDLNDPSVAAVLAAAKANIHHPLNNGAGETVALRSLGNGDEFIKALLTKDNVGSTDDTGKTILHLAGVKGAWKAVDAVVGEGADIGQKDKDGKTALDLALSRTDSIDHAKTSEKLILAGASSENPLYAYLAPPVRSSNYNIRMADGNTLYHYAADRGYTGYVDYLIEKKADVNAKNNSGSTPLHEAARSGRLAVMEKLIDTGAQVNAQDAKGNTPMHLAIPPENHRDANLLLLSHGADPNIRDEHGEIPLQVAVTLDRDYETAESLLSGKSKVDNRNIDGKTALHLAVEESRLKLIPLLLEYHADIFAKDNTGITPIELAIQNSKYGMDALAQMITDETVQQKDSEGNTILHIAVAGRASPEVISLILDEGAFVNARNKEGNTALHTAVAANDDVSGNLLLDRGADIFASNAANESPLYLAFYSPGGIREWMLNRKTLEARDGLSNTALHYASQWKLGQYAPLLVSKGAAVDAANATGETPLFWAVKSDSPETADALVKQGAKIGARDSLGNSALHCAVKWNARQSIPYLIDAGLSVDSQNLAGKAPLHEAVRLGLNDMEDALIRYGANLETRDNDGNTPLMEAVMAGFPGAAERLTNNGADAVARNNSGDTPLHIAVIMQRLDLVTLLLGKGAPIHARNSQGITPFTTALTISPNMVSALLTSDRLYSPDDDGLSPLHIAIKQRASASIIQTIISRGCRMSAVDKEGKTPLRLAIDMGSLREAKLLADSGSDVFIPAKDGKTPAEAALSAGAETIAAVFSGRAIASRDNSGNTVLHYAAKTGNTDVIGQLLSLGADKSVKNISSESPAEIASRWNHADAATILQ
jgi:ankyrin repeat protein